MKLDITNEFDFSGLKSFTEKLNNLDNWEVEYGYYDDQSHPESELTLADLAWLMEVGSNKSNIPPRKFLFQSFIEHKSRPESHLEAVTDILFNKKPLRTALKELGREGEDIIEFVIERGRFPRNSPITIAIKGFDKPLVETGYLQTHAKSKVVKTGDS